MANYTRRSSGKYRPDNDRGNGWYTCKDEWQDYDRSEERTVTVKELQDMRTPGTGSLITIDLAHIKDGLKFHLYVSEKEYRKACLLYTSPSPRDRVLSRMPSSA